MTKLQWAAVAGVLGLGILSQIPAHDHEEMPGHDHEVGVLHDDNTVILAVSGMT